jgi:hypothetical protein
MGTNYFDEMISRAYTMEAFRFQSEKSVLGMELKTKMRERGWLKVPPSYIPPGAPTN